MYLSGAGSFHAAMGGFRMLQGAGVNCGVRLTVTPGNVDSLAGDVDALVESGITSYMLGVCSGVLWSKQALDRLSTQLEIFYGAVASGVITLIESEEPEEAAPYGCSAGRGLIAVSPGGEIWCCGRVMDIPSPSLKLGDVTFGLVQLRNRAVLAGGVAAQRACEQAGFPADYRGWCYIENFVENGDPFEPSLWQYEVCTRVSAARAKAASHCL